MYLEVFRKIQLGSQIHIFITSQMKTNLLRSLQTNAVILICKSLLSISLFLYVTFVIYLRTLQTGNL